MSDSDIFDEKGNRFASDADREEFKDELRAELEAIKEGEKQKTMSVWDGDMAAVIRALEDGDELTDRGEEVGKKLQKALGRDENVDKLDRSELMRMTFRLGLKNAAPNVVDDLLEVKKESVEQL